MAHRELVQPEKLWAKEIYPTRKITWIIPVKPGGGFDTLARFISLPLTGARVVHRIITELLMSACGK